MLNAFGNASLRGDRVKTNDWNTPQAGANEAALMMLVLHDDSGARVYVWPGRWIASRAGRHVHNQAQYSDEAIKARELMRA